MRRLILRSFQSPGDILMLTAAVRDLHAAHPQQFLTDVRTSVGPLWENNPYITPLDEGAADVEVLDMHYPLIHEANERPLHFIHGYSLYLEDRLGLRIPVSKFHGEIHLSVQERESRPTFPDVVLPDHYWIIVGGGKFDFTAKWWSPQNYQKVVDSFEGRIAFVQCGEASHWHPPLQNVINLVGRTSIRDLVWLMRHADGVVCPVTFAMHLAAAVETSGGRRGVRPCVVIAGGREPAHWEAYPHHQFISTNGALTCCASGGCWKSRCQQVGDGDQKDQHNLCEQPVAVAPKLSIPRCMELIDADEVVRRIELYYRGGALKYHGHSTPGTTTTNMSSQRTLIGGTHSASEVAKEAEKCVSVSFYHGLGDCAYFAHLIAMYVKRGYQINVECTPDKEILFEIAGARIIPQAAAKECHAWGYPSGGTFEGHGRFWQGSKMGHNISRFPMPDIGPENQLWDEFVDTRLNAAPYIPPEISKVVEEWLEGLMRPIVLFHSMGNSGQERKSLPKRVTQEFYQEFINTCEGTLLLLDWDNRVPMVNSWRIRHLSEFGGATTLHMFALMSQADLLIGIDSGPLHAARFTNIPVLGLWMPGHYPTTYTLPRANQLNVVLQEHTQQWNRFKRIPWNIIEHPGREFNARFVADVCHRMQASARFLPGHQAADVQLQQFIETFCRCSERKELSSFWDRNRSFDTLFREMTARFASPTVIETGTIRAEEDWGGAGFFTYLAGAYLFRRGGELHSVDITPGNCAFARDWTAVFGSTVTIHEQNSIEFLADFDGTIDVLYLDSLDTSEPSHAAHAMLETKAALNKLTDDSLIIFDDTPWSGDRWCGKGAEAVPWLLRNGWKILYAGYQVLLTREK